jgi:hypothetical protein
MPDDETPDIPGLNFDPDRITDEPVVPDFRASQDRATGFVRGTGFPFSRAKPAGDKRSTTRTPKARVTVPKVKPGHFVEPLTQMYAGIAMALMPFDPVCANAVMVSASRCAESLDKLAQENDAVRRALFALTRTTAMGMVFVAHMPILLAITIHHVPAAQNMLGQMGKEMADQIARQMNADGETPPEAND